MFSKNDFLLPQSTYFIIASQAVKSDILLYVDDSDLMHEHIYIWQKLKIRLNKDFENIWDCFIDNKLSIHFVENKTRLNFLASKRGYKKIRKINIRYKKINPLVPDVH